MPRSKRTDAAPARAADVIHLDGWANLLTGLGDASRDKRKASLFQHTRLTYGELAELYRGEDLAARIVEALPDDALREGFTIHVPDEAEEGQRMLARMEELEVEAALFQALAWRRAYGGAAILLGVDDGQADPAKPLQLRSIRSLQYLTVLDASELKAATYQDDPLARDFGRPVLYEIRPHHSYTNGTATAERSAVARQGQLVHASRFILFDGVRVNRKKAHDNHGWGDSVLQRVHEVLRDFGTSWDAAGFMMAEGSPLVFKFKALAQLLAAGKGDALRGRVTASTQMMSLLRGLIVDESEDVTRLAQNFSGVPEMLEKFTLRLAAAARMPVTILMGQSPAGLNATGESDHRSWHATVRAEQRRVLKPALERLCRLLWLSQDGPTRGKEPPNWTVGFPSLWLLTPQEEATERNTQATADVAYIQAGVLTPEEVALSRFGGGKWSAETSLDMEAREALAPALEAAEGSAPDEEDTTDPTPPPPRPGLA